MKIVFCKWFPPFKFSAINLFGVLIVKEKHRNMFEKYGNNYRVKRLINHESIHTKQMKEMLYIPFYVQYVIEWFFKIFTEVKAYKNISFEREAYTFEEYFDGAYGCKIPYLKCRKRFACFKYLFRRNPKYEISIIYYIQTGNMV